MKRLRKYIITHFLFKSANNRLDTKEFYELMQQYRHSPLSDQKGTALKYNEVIEWIRNNYS